MANILMHTVYFYTMTGWFHTNFKNAFWLAMYDPLHVKLMSAYESDKNLSEMMI